VPSLLDVGDRFIDSVDHQDEHIQSLSDNLLTVRHILLLKYYNFYSLNSMAPKASPIHLARDGDKVVINYASDLNAAYGPTSERSAMIVQLLSRRMSEASLALEKGVTRL